jgi:poly-D-alanine transfer protein DltD
VVATNSFHFFYVEKITMKTRIILGVILLMFVLVQAVNAGGKDDIQKYFNDTACKVKATDDPVQKREILNTALQTMSTALEMVESSELISQDDRAGINLFKKSVQEKQNELMGSDGYTRVADAQLNAFSNYVVQDMEQAQTLTISLVSALLIVVILILLL